jgi:hypothetical protein
MYFAVLPTHKTSLWFCLKNWLKKKVAQFYGAYENELFRIMWNLDTLTYMLYLPCDRFSFLKHLFLGERKEYIVSEELLRGFLQISREQLDQGEYNGRRTQHAIKTILLRPSEGRYGS